MIKKISILMLLLILLNFGLFQILPNNTQVIENNSENTVTSNDKKDYEKDISLGENTPSELSNENEVLTDFNQPEKENANIEEFLDKIKIKDILEYERIFKDLYPDTSIVASAKFVNLFAYESKGYWYLPSGIEAIRYKRPGINDNVNKILEEIKSIKMENKSFINGVAFYNINGNSAYSNDFATQRAAQTNGSQVFIYNYHSGDITHEIGHVWQKKYIGKRLTNENTEMISYAKSRGWNIKELNYNKWSGRISERQAEDFSNTFYKPINIRGWREGYSQDYFIRKMNGDNNKKIDFNYKVVTSENYKELIKPKLKAMYEEYRNVFETEKLPNDLMVTRERFDGDLEKVAYDRIRLYKGNKINVYYVTEKNVFFEHNGENYSTYTGSFENQEQ